MQKEDAIARLKNIEIFKFEQGSEEWFDIRNGLCTSSEVKSLLAADRGFNTYLMQKKAEQYLEKVEVGWSGNYWMKRGKELEPIARQKFEESELIEVEQIGFIRNLKLMAGSSTDGIIRNIAWGVEIKCFDYKKHYEVIELEGPTTDAYNQMQFAMAISGLKGFYSVNYNPNFKKGYQLLIHKVERNETSIRAIRYLLMHVKMEIGKLKI